MASSTRKMFGVSQKPLPATSVRVKAQDATKFGNQGAKTLMVIDEVGKTVVFANLYGGDSDPHLGKGFDASKYIQALPPADSAKWKEWTKAGYEANKADGTPWQVSDFPVLTQAVPADVKEPAEASA